MSLLSSRSVIVFALAFLAVALALGGLRADARQAQPDPVAGVDYVDGRVLVKFVPGAAVADQARAHAAASGRVIDQVGGLDVQIVDVGPGRTIAAIKAYSRNPNVLYAEVDGIVHASLDCSGEAGTFSNDPCSGRQWGLHNTGQDYGAGTGTPDADVDIPEAWGTGASGAGVTIAILDSGYDANHPDLTVAASRNFISSDPNATSDGNGHGTWTASIAAAQRDSDGMTGVAPGARLIVGKVLNDAGSGSWSQIASGINWAVQNSNGQPLVISMSLGGTCRGGGPFGCQTLQTAVQSAHGAGALLIAAAGNSSGSTEYPGAYPEVLSVAATDANDAIASFSSQGEVAAPGVNILGAFPVGTPETCASLTAFSLQGSHGKECLYDYGNGTSASTPIVAGIAALVWDKNPAWTNQQVRDAVFFSARDVPGTTYDGAGRVSACYALGLADCGSGGGTVDPGATPEPTDTPEPTASPTATPETPTPTPGDGSITLTGSSANNGRTWTAQVVLSGTADVLTGSWSYGDGGSCIEQTCILSGIPKNVGSVTFTASSPPEAGSITISKP